MTTASVDSTNRAELMPTLLTFAVVIWGYWVTAVAAPHADPLTLTMLRAAPTALCCFSHCRSSRGGFPATAKPGSGRP